MMSHPSGLCLAALVAAAALGGAPAAAQVPGEVTGVSFADAVTLVWDPTPGAQEYEVHEGPASFLTGGVLLTCGGDKVGTNSFKAEKVPKSGRGLFYLVTARNQSGIGTPGRGSDGLERYLRGTCAGLATKRILDRAGFGWSEWQAARIAALGIQGYLAEQLDPAVVDESTNTELANRRAAIDPPETIIEQLALDIVNATYARRQLEQHVALFWDNHFNTDYKEVNGFFFRYRDDPARRRLESTKLIHDELEQFRSRAFGGSFRQILEDSALSPAMIIYLDTDNNVAGRPNENYARELLELHTMGVDGGYTHDDIDAIARIMTGWNVCKKPLADAGNYLTGCISNSLIGTVDEPDGVWVTNFRQGRHDCGAKTLFAGTPQETTIPDTCARKRDGVNDVQILLDTLAAHPSTERFISRKLLEAYVTEDPTQAMLDAVLAVWRDPAQPAGRGDLREILRAVLGQIETADPLLLARQTKIRTPVEHVAAVLRAIRGHTNGIGRTRQYVKRMQHRLHENPIPTGYSERGLDWIDTNGLLERLNIGMDLAEKRGQNFGSDLINLLTDSGIPTGPGHAAEIVDFLADVFFAGAISAAQHEAAIRYLETDETGAPSPYDDARIRATAGFMLGWPQMLEQ